MLSMLSLFKKAGKLLFGSAKNKKTSKKQKRTLRIEELEAREMLSATPLDEPPIEHDWIQWDWEQWWDSFAHRQLDALPQGYNTDAEEENFGQISIGGNETQISADSPHMPSEKIGLTAFDTGTRQGTAALLNGDGHSITGYNTETITVGIVSQDLGGGNWYYTETAAYTYNITAGNQLYWGGYSYVLSASFIDGIYESTFFLTTSDYFTQTDAVAVETETSTLNLATITTGSITETVITTHFHNTLTSERNASDTRITHESTLYTGAGTYSTALTDGQVSGTIEQSGMSTAKTSVEIWMLDTGDGWGTTGTQWALTTESSSSTYQGNGSYSVITESEGYFSHISGVIAESGSESEARTLTVAGELNDGAWSLNGTGAVTSASSTFYAQTGSGSYTQSVAEPGNSSSLTGTHSESTLRENSSNGDIQLLLVGEVWEIVSGTNEASGQSSDTSQYSESGSYSRSGVGGEEWSSSGAFAQSGNTGDTSGYTITSVYLLGGWQTTGSEYGSGHDHSCYTYDSTGTYTSVFSKDDGSSFTMSGTSSQSGYGQSSMNYQTQALLPLNGSWSTSGSGEESGSSHEESSYTGNGSFAMMIGDSPLTGHNIAGGGSYQGAAHHNGNAETTSVWDVSWSMQNGNWERISGMGTTADSQRTHLSFSGSADTAETYTQGGVTYSTASHRNTRGYENDESQITLNLAIVAGDWEVLNGMGSGCGESFSHHDYLTNGSYFAPSSNVEGIFASSGHETSTSISSLQFTWNESGWDTTGVIDYTEGGSQQSQRSGNGTITLSMGANSAGTTTITNSRTESFAHQTTTQAQWQEQIHADGSQTLTEGYSNSTFSSNEEWTTNGTGTFSEITETQDGGTLTTAGTTTFAQTWTSNSAGNELFAVINHVWELDGGTYEGTDTDYNFVSKNGTGTLTKGNKSSEITTVQWDETDIHTMIAGNVTGNAGNKEWGYSGDETYKDAGAYSYAETTREAEYQRNIAGGTIHGTAMESFANFNNYESEITSRLTEGDSQAEGDQWEITAGAALMLAGYSRIQSYEGYGNYSLQNLTGTVTESGSYSTVADGIRVVSAYNTDTKDWEDSEEGIITYVTTENFSDSSSGSLGNVTINARTATFASSYTETHSLETGIIDHEFSYTESALYDAVEVQNAYNGIAGTYTKTDAHQSQLTLDASWTLNTGAPNAGNDGWAGTRISLFTENRTENFTLADGNSTYDTYTYNAADSFEGTLTETLMVPGVNALGEENDFAAILWNEDAWQQIFLEAESIQLINHTYTKSSSSNNVYSVAGNYGTTGTASSSESYSYEKKLQKQYAGETVTGSGYERIHANQSASFTGGNSQKSAVQNGYAHGNYDNNFLGGTGISESSSWSNASSVTDLIYLWDGGGWQITGGAVTTEGFGYTWSDSVFNVHATGTATGEKSASHSEQVTIQWDYDSQTGALNVASIDGGGCGEYNFLYDWNSSANYQRGFYNTAVTGTEEAFTYHSRNDHWEVTFRMVNGELVRETEGESLELIIHGTAFAGGGEYSTSTTTVTPNATHGATGTKGTSISHYGFAASLAESGTQWYREEITTEWSHTADDQGQLSRQSFSESVIVVGASGTYSTSTTTDSYYQYDGMYASGNAASYANGYHHALTASAYTASLSEHYEALMTIVRQSDGGDFSLVSAEGTACGEGMHRVSGFRSEFSETFHEWGCSFDCGYPCFFGYDTYELYDYHSEGCRETAYDYTAEWGWDNSGIYKTVANHISKGTDETEEGYWHYVGRYHDNNGSSYCCADSCSNVSGCGWDGGCCGGGCYDFYDEVVNYTGWRSDESIIPSGVRWSPFVGVPEGNSSCGSSGCGCSDFSAPGFSVTFGHDEITLSPSGRYPSIPNSHIPERDVTYSTPSGSSITWAFSNIDPQPDFGNYQEVDVNALLPPLPKNYEPLIVATVEDTNGFGSFAVTFGKAMVNGSVSALVSTFTIGFIEYKPFDVTDQDIANGYVYMEAGAVIVTHVGMAFGTAGLGCVASLGSTAAKGAVMTMRTIQAADAALDVVDGGMDMIQNGITLENTTQVASGLIGFAGLGGSKCFTEGTQIVAGAIYDENDVFVQYVTVNIEDINVGDFVYSYDTITGTTELKEVTDVFVRESDHINYLTIVDESGNVQVLETTDGHPFWVVTDEPDLERAAREYADGLYHENIAPGLNGFWVEAKDLREGDVFVGANGELSVLVSAERVVFPENVKVYNFTVEGNHNYFVIAKDDPFGQTCILVHNANVSLYQAIDKATGKTYYGITNDLKRRTSEHARNGIEVLPKPLLENMSRIVAKAAEQIMINRAGLANLANKINSIAPGKQGKFVKEMAEALRRLGGG